MVSDLDTLGRSLTTLDVSELTMLPRFTPEDAARWPVVLSERADVARCVVAGDHDAELSTTIGHPHSGDPQWWLDLCVAHAEELTRRFGYRVDTSGRAGDDHEAEPDDAGADAHPLAAIQDEAAAGRDDAGAPEVLVLPPLPGPCDTVLFLRGRVVVAADLDPDWVHARAAASRDHDPLDAVGGWGAFLAAVAERLGDPPVQTGLLAVASHRAPMLRGGLTLGGEADPGWAPYRRRVRTYRYRSSATEGHIDSGLGPAGRMEVYPRLRISRNSGSAAGREVVAAARSLAPDAAHVYGTAPLHDTAALRVLLDASFTPIGTEALLLIRRGPGREGGAA